MTQPRILTAHLIAEMDLMWDIIARTEEEGECWMWQGATLKGGYPIMKVRGCGCRYVRREVVLLAGKPLSVGQPVDSTCGERRCVNPAHLFPSSTSAIALKAAKRGAFSGFARSAKIAAYKRATAKLTLEQALEIRVSPESGPVLAAKFGVNRSVITGIKSGKRWKDYANPFAGLMK